MDHIADHYLIYKVKTIGDAYFAITGPSCLFDTGDTAAPTTRMLKFASDCAQIFSGVYQHPDAGDCLKV